MNTETTIEQIPSDETVTMTEYWHRAFNAAGCNPMCHCCHSFIKPGDLFKLSTIREVTGKSNNSLGWAPEILSQIVNPSDNPEMINDETKEVMLCGICTPELFQRNQLDNAKFRAELYKKNREAGGGCFRINGKIIH